jgi:molecular chaperone HtpG
MSEVKSSETREFQTEAKQLLHLMTHSLYSNREIFLRELISNASDACDKLRFEALNNADLLEDSPDSRVRIDLDEKKKTITITDNGIGMDRQEVIDNIGTIASSGTAKFVDQLSGDEKKDSALIGQFGVGFYSAFIVADKVDVFTRRAGLEASEGVHWSCTGEAEYEIEAADLPERGTKVVLKLKKDMKEFLDEWNLKTIIRKYSDHIAIPVEMKSPPPAPVEEGEDVSDAPEAPEYTAINAAVALWARPRTEVSNEEYQEFYRQLTHDFQEPLLWSHNKLEGKLDYTSLLFVPSVAPADLWRREGARGLKLYVKRTFILDDAEQFLPMYLRFVKGVLDTNDLPLNVSRELLQDSPQVTKIRNALSKRIVDLLAKTAKKDSEKYQKFWDAFGPVLKEGVVEDPENQKKLADLFRFATTSADSSGQDQSLAGYIERMPENQEKIYFLIGETPELAARSPLLESFRKAGTEVLLLSDGIDEWLMSNLTEYQEKSFQNIARGDLSEDLGEKKEEATEESKEDEAESPLIARVKTQLDTQVDKVRASKRLVDSPSCLVLNEFDMGAQMRRIMEASGQKLPESKPILEINMQHPLVERMDKESDEDRFADFAQILFDQAKLGNGETLADPTAYVQRINKLLLEL